MQKIPGISYHLLELFLDFHAPGGLGVRMDSAAYNGYQIPPYYDSLIGKLIVHGKTRTQALMILKRVLDEIVINGIDTTIPLFQALLKTKAFHQGKYHIHWLENWLKEISLEESLY